MKSSFLLVFLVMTHLSAVGFAQTAGINRALKSLSDVSGNQDGLERTQRKLVDLEKILNDKISQNKPFSRKEVARHVERILSRTTATPEQVKPLLELIQNGQASRIPVEILEPLNKHLGERIKAAETTNMAKADVLEAIRKMENQQRSKIEIKMPEATAKALSAEGRIGAVAGIASWAAMGHLTGSAIMQADEDYNEGKFAKAIAWGYEDAFKGIYQVQKKIEGAFGSR